MPTGPKGERRRAGVIGNDVIVRRIATDGEADSIPNDGKNAAAKALGAMGGVARAKAMTPEQRVEIAKAAAAKRWERS